MRQTLQPPSTEVVAQAGQPDADPFDLLCRLASSPAGLDEAARRRVLTRRQRVPSLLEQRQIVAELDALQAEVDALKRPQAETAVELDALLPAVLDRAFKGEL
jgi:hypothetical protein